MTDLKNRLSHYLRLVARGEHVTILDRGRPVARTAARELAAAWTEISALGAVRDRAVRLVATHPVRAADAMQLGAALVAVADRPAGHAFVCTDGRLRDAAGREGFLVLPEA